MKPICIIAGHDWRRYLVQAGIDWKQFRRCGQCGAVKS